MTMGAHTCRKCWMRTGRPELHDQLVAEYFAPHAPDWEVCTCGSGGHPRECDLHPDTYQRHCDELNAEAGQDELVAERDRYRAALEAIAALDCEHNAVDDEQRKRGEWCDGPCGDISRAALEGES